MRLAECAFLQKGLKKIKKIHSSLFFADEFSLDQSMAFKPLPWRESCLLFVEANGSLGTLLMREKGGCDRPPSAPSDPPCSGCHS